MTALAGAGALCGSVAVRGGRRLSDAGPAATAYSRLRMRLPADREDELVAELWGLGTLGLQLVPAPERRLEVTAWFPAAAGPAAAAALEQRRGGWGIERVACEVVPAADWLAAYRRRARPFPLGERFWADPREPNATPAEAPAGRRLLRLPARTAFGTGSHASTRLVVELMEERPPRGLDVLDVGTGSGVLALAALELGARRALGIEIDPAAALQAGRNRALNGLPMEIVAGTTAAVGAAEFDLVLANMTLASLQRSLGEAGRLLRPRGEAILSGALVEQEAELRRLVASAGLESGRERKEGDWLALRARRAGR